MTAVRVVPDAAMVFAEPAKTATIAPETAAIRQATTARLNVAPPAEFGNTATAPRDARITPKPKELPAESLAPQFASKITPVLAQPTNIGHLARKAASVMLPKPAVTTSAASAKRRPPVPRTAAQRQKKHVQIFASLRVTPQAAATCGQPEP